MLTSLFAGDQFEHSYRHRLVMRTDLLPGVQGDGSPWRFGGQEEDLVDTLSRAGLECRKQGCQRFTDTGGSLREQRAAAPVGVVDSPRQQFLAGAKLRMRKRHVGECCVAALAVRLLLLCPTRKALTERLEMNAQRLGKHGFEQQGLLAGIDVVVNQRQFQAGQTAQLTRQMTIDASLRPMQRPLPVGNAVGLAAMGLDFFEPAQLRIKAIGPTPYLQDKRCLARDRTCSPLKPVLGAERQFGLVVRPSPADHRLVAGHAFGRGRRRRRAQFKTARAGTKLTQIAHADRIRRHRVRRGRVDDGLGVVGPVALRQAGRQTDSRPARS